MDRKFSVVDAGPVRTAAELAALARRFYGNGHSLLSKLMPYRTYICPLEALIPYVAPGATVMDVGCGAGLFLALLAGTVPRVEGFGFDSSRAAIGTALRMSAEVRRSGFSAQLRFETLDATRSWPAGMFDVVSLIDVMHHIPPAQQKSIFLQASRSVNPNGLLLYSEMADRPPFYAVMNRVHDLLLARQWIHYVPIGIADGWAAECGFSIEEAGSVSRFWYRRDIRVYRRGGLKPAAG
jgi:2-polyprenyl-3-methyl-5-hydroxy-6-metoxy-1,4-benzoquinol methylase